MSAKKDFEDVLNLNVLVFLGIKCFVFWDYSKILKSVESKTKHDKNYQSDNFTLNNDKLMNTIKIKNTIEDLKKYCVKLSKDLFIKWLKHI